MVQNSTWVGALGTAVDPGNSSDVQRRLKSGRLAWTLTRDGDTL